VCFLCTLLLANLSGFIVYTRGFIHMCLNVCTLMFTQVCAFIFVYFLCIFSISKTKENVAKISEIVRKDSNDC
jgi:hypothetical protein